jgi:predicted metal-dependent phosphoesterase TrpH
MSQQPAQSPFSTPGNWYRGNLHTHTTNSDGRLKPVDAVTWYRTHGYDFMVITDHDLLTDVSGMSDEHFLVLPGVEIHAGRTSHGIIYELLVIGVRRLTVHLRPLLRSELK